MIFHAACPNPIQYRDDAGLINTVTFYEDLKIWQAHVCATWMSMTATDHDVNCRCCINFRHLCTNYEDDLQELLKDAYDERRISKLEILRWGEMISRESYRKAFESIKTAAGAWVRNQPHEAILDVSTDSSNISDAQCAGKDESSSNSSDGIPTRTRNLDVRNDAKNVSKRRKRQHSKGKRALTISKTNVRETALCSVETSQTGVHELATSGEPTRSKYSIIKHLRSGHERQRHRGSIKQSLDSLVDISTHPRKVIISDGSTGKAIRVVTDSSIIARTLSEYVKYFIMFANVVKCDIDLFRSQSAKRQKKMVDQGARSEMFLHCI